MQHSTDIVKANCVIGVTVKNEQKENLGKVEEILINKSSGEVAYCVLSFGGFLTMGDKYFAIPWQMFSYWPDENCFLLNVDKEQLKNAPGFDKNSWPDTADSLWEKSINDFYKVDIKNRFQKIGETMSTLKDKAQEKLAEGYAALKDSGEETCEYAQKHPLQTVVNCVVGYLLIDKFVKFLRS